MKFTGQGHLQSPHLIDTPRNMLQQSAGLGSLRWKLVNHARRGVLFAAF